MRAIPAVLDAVVVLLFAAAGRATHSTGLGLPGVAGVAWPFLAGAAVGWLLLTALRRDGRGLAAGVVVWLAATGGGMVLRVVTGEGTALAFVVVATLVLGLGMLGWRVVAAIVPRRGG